MKIVAAQIPTMGENNLVFPDMEPRNVEISIGGEMVYAESMGFPATPSMLLCIYVDGSCALELSIPADEAEKLEYLIGQQRPKLMGGTT